MTKAREKFIIQQRGYYLGGKGYAGALCRRVRVATGRVYGNLNAAIRDAGILTSANDNGWQFVVYPFIDKEVRIKQIQATVDRLPKDENGKPKFRTEGDWNCSACHEEGFILNDRGFFEPCPVCNGTGVLEGEWA